MIRAREIGAAVAALVVAGSLVACANQVTGQGQAAERSSTSTSSTRTTGRSSGFPTPTGTSRPTPTTSGTRTSGSPTPTGESSVRCPNITDVDAGLSYPCVDNSLTEDVPDKQNVLLTVETDPSGWVAEQASGFVDSDSTDTPEDVATGLTAVLLDENYLDNPTSTTQKGAAVTINGRSGYRLDTLITLDPAAAAAAGTTTKQELLCVVAVQLDSGDYIAMEISVPDTKKAWWSRYDTVVSAMKVTG